MNQEIIKTKIPHIGEVQIKVLQVEDKWWLNQIVIFITQSQERFAIIAISNPALKSEITFQNTLQRFITFIQSGGEPQAANRITTHFNNWINKQNGTFTNNGSFKPNGSSLSGTSIIEPDREFNPKL